jgi:hypothetical protein
VGLAPAVAGREQKGKSIVWGRYRRGKLGRQEEVLLRIRGSVMRGGKGTQRARNSKESDH